MPGCPFKYSCAVSVYMLVSTQNPYFSKLDSELIHVFERARGFLIEPLLSADLLNSYQPYLQQINLNIMLISNINTVVSEHYYARRI